MTSGEGGDFSCGLLELGECGSMTLAECGKGCGDHGVFQLFFFSSWNSIQSVLGLQITPIRFQHTPSNS